MRFKPTGRILLMIPALAACLLSAGCHIDTHKNSNGDDVRVDTPFGGVSVKTDEASAQQGVGLSVYPGAYLVKKDNDESDAADVNIGFGGFMLKVKAVSYQTPDPPDKVLAFYRNDMSHYGVVIQCHGPSAVGTPDHTPDGLTCASDNNNKIHISNDFQELKAGSHQKQHIVDLHPQGSGTKIGLIAIELPGHFGDNSDRQ
jgi:hypothetical protein